MPLHNVTACIYSLKGKPLTQIPESFSSGGFHNKSVFNPSSPDISPAGSVGKNQYRCLVLGQTGHYSKNYTFNAFQNVSSGKTTTLNIKCEHWKILNFISYSVIPHGQHKIIAQFTRQRLI